MENRYDAVVVGAGPGGSLAAKTLAENGAKVLLIEKRGEVGVPVRCGEATGIAGLKKFGITPWKRAVAWSTCGAYLYAPDGTRIDIVSNKPNGYILERRIFDKQLAVEAADAGAEVEVKAYALGLLRENNSFSGVKIKHFNEKKEVQCKIIVGADGIEGKIGRWAGINTRTKLSEMTSNVQFELSNIKMENSKITEFYFGTDVAPGGYAWVFPKGEDCANVGLGIRAVFPSTRLSQSGDSGGGLKKSAMNYLKNFIDSHENLKKGKIVTMVAGGVPVQGPLERSVKENVLLVGDSARQVDPLTGGGIINAMIAGKIAGNVISKCFESEKNSLLEYEKLWRAELEKRLMRSLNIKNVLEKMDNEGLNKVAKLMKSMKFGKLDVKELTTSMLSMPKELISFIKSFM